MATKYKKEKKQEVANWVMNVDATDPIYDPVVVSEIKDGRILCENCSHYNVDPRASKCRIGEVQYRGMLINCSKFYAKVKITPRTTNERFWE